MDRMDHPPYPAHDALPDDDRTAPGPPVTVKLIYHPPAETAAIVPARSATTEPPTAAAAPAQPSRPQSNANRPRRAPLSQRHTVSAPPAPRPGQPPPLDLTRHASRCTICRHPERDAIEEEFIHWHRPGDIAWHYKIDMRAIYRHAHAFDLYSVRDRNLRFALGHVVQRAEEAQVTGDSIVRAVRAYSRVNHAGQWIDPPAHVIVSSGSHAPAVSPELPAPPEPPFDLLPAPESPAFDVPEAPDSLDTESQTKHDPTR